MTPARIVVAIPIKNEAERLEACLDALDAQSVAHDLAILALVNNSSDESAAIARRFRRNAEVHVHEVKLARADASAGGARRLAMQLATEIAGADGVLFTTDADSRVAPDWVDRNLDALAAGADAVAGRAVIDPLDEARIPSALIEADALECRYAALLDRIASYIDPDPNDPWPRHDEHSGASIAVTVRAYHRAGGIPDIALGEDRAFFLQLRRTGARVRHAPDVTVTVSGRTDGRAKDGMADTIRRRLVSPDIFLDDRLESATAATKRFSIRKAVRLICAGRMIDHRQTADDLQLPLDQFAKTLNGQIFGRAWDDIEGRSPVLVRRPVPVSDVLIEIENAQRILFEICHGTHPRGRSLYHGTPGRQSLRASRTRAIQPSASFNETAIPDLG